MPDHGLFVAGIIHSIAPAATLHLYEVLNAYGVGDLQTITNGLIKALENPLALNHKLVINLSLVFNLPYIYVEEIQEMEQPGRRHSYAEPDFPVVLLEDEKFLDFLTRPARQFFALIIENGNPVVAAAGNDAIRNNGHSDHLVRPPSRYPAAFGISKLLSIWGAGRCFSIS